ncbi:MAG TPA: hypothetical protein VMM60_18905, partial [Ilumatobacter sp.]|nr:hypothetical protein [Ilumatobacter sp.]
VRTTVYQVSSSNGQAHTGTSVARSTKSAFTADLPDGEYLVKTVPITDGTLVSVDDRDGTIAVPAGSGCGNLYDCTWIWVGGNSWGLHGNTPTVPTVEFQFDRTGSTPTTVPNSATVPSTTRSTATPTTPTPTATTTPIIPTQQGVVIRVVDETNGLEQAVPMEGVNTVLVYTDTTSQIPQAIARRTDATGTARYTTPVAPYVVNVVAPAGYELVYISQLGAHGAVDVTRRDVLPETYHMVTMRRVTATAAPEAERPRVADPVSDAEVVLPPTPPVAQPPVVAPPTTAPATTVPPVPETVPETTVPDTVPETTVPETTVPSVEEGDDGQQHRAGADAGCDTSDDPEIQALLWTNDGAIRWLEDGELLTLYPEPGMQPVVVCLDAYHRLTELGIDIDYYTTQ